MTTKAKQTEKNNIIVFSNLAELSKYAADQFIKIGKASINKTGRFTVALAGGSTPTQLYNLLTNEEYKTKIDWAQVYFFIGDERDVSPMSEMSNYRMINETLFSKIPVPKNNIFRWHTEIIIASEVAESYNRTLSKFFDLSEGEFPRFDLIFLGMGDDGHTASLFPFTDALKEQNKIATSNYVEKLNSRRHTFTYPVINNASNVIFLISGENKSKPLKEILEGKQHFEKFPAQAVRLDKGNLFWLIDEKAATELTQI